MKNKTTLRWNVLLLSTFCTALAAWGQGSLTPPGAPGPSMKTLSQVEPRTPISSAPFSITNSGSYYLTTNLTVSASNAITILANHVTLDLNGFVISSTAPVAQGNGIQMGASRTNITIRNGIIAGRVTQTGGVFNGGGFDNGIFVTVDYANTNTYGLPSNVRVTDVTVSGVMSYGIGLPPLNTLVESCLVQIAGVNGITATTVRNCLVTECGTSGINGQNVLDSQAQCLGSGARAINANQLVQNSYGESQLGIGVFAYRTAVNSHGISKSSDDGLYASVASGCTGSSATGQGLRALDSAINCQASGGTVGLLADRVALNCTGRANTNGTGLLCYAVVQNSYGSTASGTTGAGLNANQANNSGGYHGGSGPGLNASVAIGCNGYSVSGFAVSASILNSCSGTRASGSPTFSFGNKYNMP